jgi:hypothetical protein
MFYVPTWFMEQHHHEPQPTTTLPSLPVLSKAEGRHDGWTGEKMAIFCEALAETAVVAEACDAARMGISGAYAARRRDPIFAAAWDAALSIARERLADTLLARAMEGNIEQIWRDGVVVGERHVIDNRLGLAILRRLDRLAETGLSLHSNLPPTSVRAERSRSASPAILPKQQEFDWEEMVAALQSDDLDAVAKALALVEDHEVEEVEDPLDRPPSAGQENKFIGFWHRCWKDGIDKVWMTDFPPPAGFTGYQSRDYDDLDDDERYVRLCTEEEVAIIEGCMAAERAEEREEEEALRDQWFALLRDEPEDETEEAEAGEDAS